MLGLRGKKSSNSSKPKSTSKSSPTNKQTASSTSVKKKEDSSKIKSKSKSKPFSYFITTSSKRKKSSIISNTQPPSYITTIEARGDDRHLANGVGINNGNNIETQSSSVSSSGYNSGNTNHHLQMGANLSSSSPSTAETIAASAATGSSYQQQVVPVPRHQSQRQKVMHQMSGASASQSMGIGSNYSIASRRRPLSMGMPMVPPMVPVMIGDDNDGSGGINGLGGGGGGRGDDMNNNNGNRNSNGNRAARSTNLIYHLEERRVGAGNSSHRANRLIDGSYEGDDFATTTTTTDDDAVNVIAADHYELDNDEQDDGHDDDDDGGFRQAISLQSHNYLQSAKRKSLLSIGSASNNHLLAGGQSRFYQSHQQQQSVGQQLSARSYQHVDASLAQPSNQSMIGGGGGSRGGHDINDHQQHRQVIYSTVASSAPPNSHVNADRRRVQNGYNLVADSSNAIARHHQYQYNQTDEQVGINQVAPFNHIYQPPLGCVNVNNLDYLRQHHQATLSDAYYHQLANYNDQLDYNDSNQGQAFSQFQPVDFEQFNQEQLKQQQLLQRQQQASMAMQVAASNKLAPQITPNRTPSRKQQQHQSLNSYIHPQMQHQIVSNTGTSSQAHNNFNQLKANNFLQDTHYMNKNNHHQYNQSQMAHSVHSGNEHSGTNYTTSIMHGNNNNERSASSMSRKSQAANQQTNSGRQSAATNSSQQTQPSLSCCGKLAKLLLFICNLIFWSSGLALGAWGILTLVEEHKYNLSQLLVFEPSSRMSLFQLLSWSFITLGCATILVGFCGCSALLKNNRWILGLYIFLILAIFALDLATGLLAIIFQERLVANVRLRLADKLRNEYGNQASFTAAIDYIQTRYECCGLEGHTDYDRSLWRLQRLGGVEAIVARTCCHLRNTFDDQAFVNPRPVNESMCQSADVRFHQSYRYRKGCLNDLEGLIRQKIWTFTIGCGAVGSIILLSLLFATCFCRSIPSQSSRKSSDSGQQSAAAAAVLVSAYGTSAGGMGNHVKSTATSGGHHRSYR